MSKWRDPDAWAAMRRGDDCPVCRRGAPLDVIADLEVSSVTFAERAPMRGYAVLVFRRHAVEFHDLDDEESAAFMRDIRRLSRALADITGAVKLNYEVHGNTLPHLHMHFFPRYRGDPFEGGPIESRAITAPVYGPGEFAKMEARLREAIGVAAA